MVADVPDSVWASLSPAAWPGAVVDAAGFPPEFEVSAAVAVAALDSPDSKRGPFGLRAVAQSDGEVHFFDGVFAGGMGTKNFRKALAVVLWASRSLFSAMRAWHLAELVHFLWPGSQLVQAFRALAHGQLRIEQLALAEQAQHGSSRACAVFCRTIRVPRGGCVNVVSDIFAWVRRAPTWAATDTVSSKRNWEGRVSSF